VTDKDQSPELSSKFVEEEEFAQKQMKKMQALLERQDKRENSIKNGVGAIASYIDEEMGAFKRQVLHINIDDTSTIETVVPTKGPDGIPGPAGQNGYDGDTGLFIPPLTLLTLLASLALHTRPKTCLCR
jgi:hypothetical protein